MPTLTPGVMRACACVNMCVHACARTHTGVRAYVRACVRVCVRALWQGTTTKKKSSIARPDEAQQARHLCVLRGVSWCGTTCHATLCKVV